MIEMLLDISLMLLVGGMVFFPAVVAPTVFTVFDDKQGGAFLRALFPRYYSYILIAAVIGLFGALDRSPWVIGVFAFTIVSTFWVRTILVPHLNAWRDADMAGDAVAARKFKRGHGLSVFINIAQLALLAAVYALG